MNTEDRVGIYYIPQFLFSAMLRSGLKSMDAAPGLKLISKISFRIKNSE